MIIVLDEIDHITDDTFLYQITRADNNGYIDNIQLGLIGISNDPTFREQLDAKVQSSLCETEISFPPYGTEELQKVLEQRAEIAFHQSALEEGVIPLCAALGRQDGGDARRAITLLRKAGDLARTENADSVTTDHVERAQEKLEAQQSMDIMRDLTEHEQLTLYALTTLAAEESTPARSRVVYQRYKELCEYRGRDPRTARRMRSFLSDFEILNLTLSRWNIVVRTVARTVSMNSIAILRLSLMLSRRLLASLAHIKVSLSPPARLRPEHRPQPTSAHPNSPLLQTTALPLTNQSNHRLSTCSPAPSIVSFGLTTLNIAPALSIADTPKQRLKLLALEWVCIYSILPPGRSDFPTCNTSLLISTER